MSCDNSVTPFKRGFALATGVQICDANGKQVAIVYADEATADFVIEACNQHAKFNTALQFYADPERYQGPNQKLSGADVFTPAEMPYRLDVTRDQGGIARAALMGAESVESEQAE